MAGCEPTRHLQQQPSSTKKQCVGKLDVPRQLQPGVKHLGGGQPLVYVGPQPISAIQGLQQALAKAATETAARQAAHITQGLAAQAQQCMCLSRHFGQGNQGQPVQGVRQRCRKTIGLTAARQSDRAGTGRRPRDRCAAHVQRLFAYALAQRCFSAEETLARAQFQHYRVVVQGDTRCELQRPPA